MHRRLRIAHAFALLTSVFLIPTSQADGLIEFSHATATPWLGAVEWVGENGTEWVAIPVRILPPPGDDTEASMTRVQPLGEAGSIGVAPVFSIRISTPQIVSASVGILIGDTSCLPTETLCSGQGILVQLDGGLGGGKASLGYAYVMAFGPESEKLAPLIGMDAKFSFLETWGFPTGENVRPGQSYAGLELDLTYLYVKFSLGLFYRVADLHPELLTEDESHWLFSFGVGFGF